MVSTDCPSGLRELIGENQCGLLVPPSDPEVLADVIAAILADRQLARNLSVAGLTRAENLNIASVSANTNNCTIISGNHLKRK